MENISFHEILKHKMGTQQATKPDQINAQNPFQQRVSDVSPELFFLSIDVPKRTSLKGYPKAKNTTSPSPTESKKTFTPSEKKAEKGVKKIHLDDIGQAKWARFEKMVGQNFGDSLTKSVALQSFRTFIKTVHPDLKGQGTSPQPVDFANLVKVKNELMAVLEEALKQG